MSVFDKEAFLSAEYTEANATHYTPVPEGVYVAMVDDIVLREAGDSKILDVVWNILDDELRAAMDMTTIQVRQGIFLDFERDGRLLFSESKNVNLGRLRKALGQNNPGEVWSFNMLRGAGPAQIKVTQKPDDDDPDTIYNRVVRVAPLE